MNLYLSSEVTTLHLCNTGYPWHDPGEADAEMSGHVSDPLQRRDKGVDRGVRHLVLDGQTKGDKAWVTNSAPLIITDSLIMRADMFTARSGTERETTKCIILMYSAHHHPAL